MSTSMTPPVPGRGWVFQVTALSIVLGMLLALALRTQRQENSSLAVPYRLAPLREEFLQLKQQNSRLQKDLAEYKNRCEQLSKELAEGTHSSGAFERELAAMKVFSGTVAVRGPGVVVTLKDSPKLDRSQVPEEEIPNYLVHDSDVSRVVNELYAAGAEAISINGQRLVANSSIRCVGPVVLVNSVQLAAPYVIRAVGKPDVMQKALELPGGAADALFLMNMLEVKRQPDITLPAYAGSTRFNVARPVSGLR